MNDATQAEPLPLLDYIDRTEALRAGQARAEQAADHAERAEHGWREQALDAVRRHALRNERFLAEHVKVPVPTGVTRCSIGAIMPAARRAGWIVADGYALDSYGSPKTAWRSLIYGGAA